MPFYTQPVFTKNQSARALGIFAAPGHFAASHPRLLADYEDGRVDGGGHGCFAACGRGGGTVVLDEGGRETGFTSLISVIFYDL